MRFFLRPLISIFAFLMIIYTQPAFCEDKTNLQPWSYRLGEGLRLGDTNFRLGGYISLKYLDPGGENGRFIFDDLSLFIFGDINERLRVFSEWEDAHFFEISTDGNAHMRHHGELERLYLDYAISDTIRVRVGKFLTPVGTWNEIHADPLTWTVSRPLVTFVAFPEYTTGLQLSGDLNIMEEELEYSFFLQNNESINERTGFRKTHLLYGGKVRWLASSGLEVGLPILYYNEQHEGESIYLTGVDILYEGGRFEIRGEATYSLIDQDNGGDSREYGYYIQGVYNLNERFFLIIRHEYLKARLNEGDHSAFSIGGDYKLRPQIVFKLEYQIRNGDLRFNDISINDSERFLASFAILF